MSPSRRPRSDAGGGWRARRPPDPEEDRRPRGRPLGPDQIDRETGQTSRKGVFAGGDNVNGADLVVTALADGRRAAIAIDKYLRSL